MPTVENPPSNPPPARANWTRWALVGVLALAIAGFYALGLHRELSWESVKANLDTWKAQTRENLLLSLVVFFLLYVAVTALSLPAAGILTLLAGALFGRWLGAAVANLASTLGATLAFLSSRYVLRDWVQSKFGARLAPLNEGVEKNGAYYLFLMRLVPVFPFFLINLGMGLTPMRVGTFAVVSCVGMMLGAFLFANAGTELATLDSPSDLLSLRVLISFALLGVIPLAIRKLIQFIQARNTRKEPHAK